MHKKTFLLIFSLVFFLLLLLGVETHNILLVLLDGKIAAFAESIRNPFLDNLMILATNTCGTVGAPVIFILFSLFLFFKKQKAYLYAFAGSLVLSGIAEVVIKQLVGRIRPINYLITETGFSFPSGHSTAAMVFLITSLVLIVPIIKNKVLKNSFIIFTCILFPLTALSRIYLSVHFASDVLASIFLAIACFILVGYLVKKTLPEGEINAINIR